MTWTYSDVSAPAGIWVWRDGLLDLHNSNRSVRITFALKDLNGSRTFYDGPGVRVLGYADDKEDYAHVRPVGSGHHQIGDIQVTDGGTKVSFCYRNHSNGGRPGVAAARSPWSRYTLFLAEPGAATYAPYWIDPIISNGGNPR
ncbi:MAG TPA: hypothetical protein VG939_22810 [Caulobacteraceae bacterium]|nr:hypothetical protein [Caulobacteraceae bacterium]